MSTARPATFIVSLDCEGKWGVLDHIDQRINSEFTSKNLVSAYRNLVSLLDELQLPATFAFVSAFCLDEIGASRYEAELREKPVSTGNWLAAYRAQMAEGVTDGWHLPDALRIVQDAGRHEIASHGFCHLPIGDPSVTEAEALQEFSLARQAARECGFDPRTYIFPRNGVRYQSLLAEQGWLGWRLARPGKNGALIRSAREFNTFDHADPHGNERHEVPPGYFLNWRRGVRAAFPKKITLMRWRSIIDDAVRNKRVAHLWLHPHNLINSAGTLDTLADICRYAVALREKGGLTIATQENYLMGSPA